MRDLTSGEDGTCANAPTPSSTCLMYNQGNVGFVAFPVHIRILRPRDIRCSKVLDAMGAAADARLLGRRPSPAAYALSVITAVVFSAAYLGGCQSGECERLVGRSQVVQLWQLRSYYPNLRILQAARGDVEITAREAPVTCIDVTISSLFSEATLVFSACIALTGTH